MHQLYIIEHGLAAAPGFVPVKTDTPNVLSCSGIGEDGTRPLVDQVAVVVPDDNFFVPQPRSLHRRPKMVFQEVSLFIG